MKDSGKRSDGRLHRFGWLMNDAFFDYSGDIRMTNIWGSTEKMEVGFVSRLMPVMRKIGIPPPQAEIYPIHNLTVFATPNQWPPDPSQSSSIKICYRERKPIP